MDHHHRWIDSNTFPKSTLKIELGLSGSSDMMSCPCSTQKTEDHEADHTEMT